MFSTDAPPPLTVLMTVYRAHPIYFPEAVRSILAQTFTDFEFLIVEDPSDQPAAEWLAGLADPRIQHVRNPKRTSLVDQKNQGLRASRSEFVAYLDADDVAEPDRLHKQIAFLSDNPQVSVLGSQIAIMDHTGRSHGYRCFPLDHDSIVSALPREVPLSHPSIMLRKSALLQAGGYQFRDYPAAEDYDLWSRLVRRGVRFANHTEALLRYRIHPGQMKWTYLKQSIRAILRIKQTYWVDQMNAWDRLRLWTEQAMLWLPPWFVLRLFMIVHYRRQLPLSPPSIDVPAILPRPALSLAERDRVMT